MKYCLLSLLFVFLAACSTSKHTSHVEPLACFPGAVAANTMRIHLPDSVAHSTEAKTAILARLFNSRKVKNRGTVAVFVGLYAVSHKKPV